MPQMASSCVSAVAPNKIVTTVLNMPQGALRNFAPKFEAASSASISSAFALRSSMQSKELIMTKINVAKTITEIASEGKSPPWEMINSVTKLLDIAIVNHQYKSRPLVAPVRCNVHNI